MERDRNRSTGGKSVVARRVAVLALAFAWEFFCPLPALAEHNQLVVYANVAGERVQRAFLNLERALRKAQASSPHGVTVRHVVIDEDEARLDAQMRAIVAMAPAAIAAPNSDIAMAARRATSVIPIVFASWGDPVRAGLVESLARPGHNLTGFTWHLPLEQKHLELLKECFPEVRRVGVIIDTAWKAQAHVGRELDAARARFGLEIDVFAVESEDEMARLLQSAPGKAVQAWYVTHTSLPFQRPELVIASLERTRKPVVYARSSYVAKGGLMAYQAEFGDLFEVWAQLIGRVLDGVSPAILPVERARNFELAVNIETARRTGMTIPRSILKRADRFY